MISETKVAWLNLTGSGNESAAHVIKSPRMTIMFCAFEGDPQILRIYGVPTVLHPKSDEWHIYENLFPNSVANR